MTRGLCILADRRAGGRSKDVRLGVEAALDALPRVESGNGQLYLSQPLAKVFTTAEELAKAGDSFVSTPLTALPSRIGKNRRHLAKSGAATAALNRVSRTSQGHRGGITGRAMTLKKYARA